MRTLAIVQARLGSTRFPGKVLADIGGETMIQRVVERARQIRGVDAVVVATSFATEDLDLVAYCQRVGIPVLRGGRGANDVLGRYHDIATTQQADVIVRITGDCPLLDPNVGSQVLAAFSEGDDLAYCSNVLPATFPDGCDVEAISYEALDRCQRLVEDPEEREHVTLFIHKNRERFKTANVAYVQEGETKDLSHIRLCVDGPDDLAFVQAVYAEMGRADFGLAEVLALLEAKPELLALNQGHSRNEALLSDKAEDKKKGKKRTENKEEN